MKTIALKSKLQKMPSLELDKNELREWGKIWLGTRGSKQKNGKFSKKKPNCFSKKQGMDFGILFDNAFSSALASMLGGIPVVDPDNNALLPPAGNPNCVERGKTRIVGGIRPQNYDAAYRPDGPRVVYDSKTLNDKDSIGKNWQNMINDLVSEASTVHTRFPYCIVAFIVVIPEPALKQSQARSLVRTLERLGSRTDELDQHHLAETISLCVWDPAKGIIDPKTPHINSSLRIEKLSEQLYPAYLDRYKNLPPHLSGEDETTDEEDL